MTQKRFIFIFKRFKERILVDFSDYLVRKVAEIKDLRTPVIEEFDFRGNMFSWLIRFSDMKLEIENRLSSVSFVKMHIHFNVADESFVVTTLDVGDVSGALGAEFASQGEGYEEELEQELRRMINRTLREVK